jgi:hypothetical protein
MAMLTTSAVFVVEVAFLLVNATATEMLTMSAVFVVEVAFLMVNATAMEMLFMMVNATAMEMLTTSAVFVVEAVFLMVSVTAMEMLILNALHWVLVVYTTALSTMAIVKLLVEISNARIHPRLQQIRVPLIALNLTRGVFTQTYSTTITVVP